jgi:processive 1,2-diacylglycerol beta-glucosyltransferase
MERVLLLSMGFGAGHNSAAQALLHVMEQRNAQMMYVDLLDWIPTKAHPLLQNGYHRMLNRFPAVYHYLYDWTHQSRWFRYVSGEAIKRAGWMIRRQLVRQLSQFRPTRVVATHPFALMWLSSHWRRIPSFCVVTDYELHPIWLSGTPDVLCTASGIAVPPQSQRRLWQSAARIVETGIPVKREFLKNVSKQEARCLLGLRPDRSVVLVMGGGEGMGPVRETVRELEQVGPICQVVVLTGKNEALMYELNRHSLPPHIRVEGFRPDVPLFMDAADLLITKPGGLTITEAMVKRLPLLLLNALPGQEEANRRYLLRHRVAETVQFGRLAQQMKRWLESPARREHIARVMSQLASGNAADRIADEVLHPARHRALR